MQKRRLRDEETADFRLQVQKIQIKQMHERKGGHVDT